MDTAPLATTRSDVNAALFCSFAEPAFVFAALDPYAQGRGTVLVSDDPRLLPGIPPDRRIAQGALGLDLVPIDAAEVLSRFRRVLSGLGEYSGVIVDMSWGLATVHGASSYETWGGIAQRLAAEIGAPVLSLYNKEHMIEDQVQAAMRAHRQFLAPSGLYENPFWMPSELNRAGTLDEQLAFMLGRVVPDYAGGTLFKDVERQAARGAAPDWLARPRGGLAPRSGTAARWHIHCLGRLTVYTGGSEPVDWRIPGGAPNKTRTLFAYLLQAGEKGVHSERIGELLWPEGGSEQTKRSRLHHTVTMLRKALGNPDAVQRSGDYYSLVVPVGSWLDITSFEQLCRRAISLARHGEASAALPVYFAAERLYGGDLFEDLPNEYVESENEDWCLPRRIWLREMAIRVQFDMAKLLRKEGRTNEALDRVQRALALDPTSEEATAEAMRVLHAQGRIDAIHRQYKQYLAASAAIGETNPSPDIKALYDDLCRSLASPQTGQRETKAMTLR